MKKTIAIILFLVLTACSNLSQSKAIAHSFELAATITPMPVRQTIESPKPGLSTITGKLLMSDGTLLSRTPIYLTPGKGPDNQYPFILVGPNNEEGDYFTSTDDNAFFVLRNLQPGVYYLIASSTNNYSYVIEDSKPLQIKLLPDKLIDLGNLYVILD